MSVVTIYVNFTSEVPFYAVPLGELLDFLLRTGFLAAELVARKSEYAQTR